MAYTTQQPDNYARRLSIIRRHLIGLTAAFEELERDLAERQAPQPDGEWAAQQAREVVYRQGPQEVKILKD